MFAKIISLFGKPSTATAERLSGSIPVASALSKILPSFGYRKQLLYVSDKSSEAIVAPLTIQLVISSEEVVEVQSDDPSTIFTSLPIEKPSSNNLESPGYFPSYGSLSPEQRYLYLAWLLDVRQPIDIGFVFIYYYGLERHLVAGNFDLAFDEILLLRKHHKNSSFQSYSSNSLLCATFLKKRFDKISVLEKECVVSGFTDIQILVAAQIKASISPEQFISVVCRMPDINVRYIKSNPDIYIDMLNQILTTKYSQPSFPIYQFIDLPSVPVVAHPGFANVTLPAKIRTPSIPAFLQYEPLAFVLLEIHKNAHELTKAKLKELRKKASA